MISEFHLYVGYSEHIRDNEPCPGGPFAYPLDDTYDTYEFGTARTGSRWNSGVESFCGKQGNFVSIVREATASPQLDEIVLCAFGVIASPEVIPQRYQHL